VRSARFLPPSLEISAHVAAAAIGRCRMDFISRGRRGVHAGGCREGITSAANMLKKWFRWQSGADQASSPLVLFTRVRRGSDGVCRVSPSLTQGLLATFGRVFARLTFHFCVDLCAHNDGEA
jgi:hypothetical protein